MRPIVLCFWERYAPASPGRIAPIAHRRLCIIEHMFYMGGREVTSNAALVPGLTYREHWLSADEQAALIAELDALPWRRAAGRRTQVHTLRRGNCPASVVALATRVAESGMLATSPAKIEVVEYQPGDAEDGSATAAEGWATISLGSPCVMMCEHPGRRLAVPLLLSPGGLLAHRRGAGSPWQLSIPGRKIDQFEGRRFPRSRRLALRLV